MEYRSHNSNIDGFGEIKSHYIFLDQENYNGTIETIIPEEMEELEFLEENQVDIEFVKRIGFDTILDSPAIIYHETI